MRFGLHIGPTFFRNSHSFTPELVKKIDLSRQPLEWLGELLALAAIVTHIALIASGYGLLPDIIPTHFNFSGQANDWSGKSTLLFLLGANIVMYIMMTALANFPQLYNSMVAITPENCQRQFLLMRAMLLAIKALVAWMLCYISYQIMAVTQGEAAGIGWPLWALMGLIMAVTGIGLVLSYKLR